MQKRDRITRWLPLLIVGVGVLAYFNTFPNAFVLDDTTAIVSNPEIHRLWPISLKLRVLGDLTFKLNYAIGRTNVADYHAANIVIHLLAGLALYGVIRRTLLLPLLRERYGRIAPALAVACAVIWVAHPLQTQSVTYICQRYESLMGLFFLFSIYSFIRAEGSARRCRWLGLCILSCLLGSGVKEIIVTAPIVILLYDYVFVSGSFPHSLKRRWRFYIPLFMTMAVPFILSSRSIGVSAENNEQVLSHVSPLRYLFTQFGVMTHYLRLVVWPWPQCFDYEWQPAYGIRDVLVPGAFIVFVGGLALWALYKRKPFGFLGASFFLILAPTSSVMPLPDMAFEHRMYLPSAAVIVFLVFAGHAFLAKLFARLSLVLSARRVLTSLFACTVCGALVCLTVVRNRTYRTEEALWTDVVDKRPQNLRARLSLGKTLLDKGDIAGAEGYIEGVIDTLSNADTPLSPYDSTQYVRALEMMGSVRFRQNDLEGAESLFRRALETYPHLVSVRNNLGMVLQKSGRDDDAVREWKAALTYAPNAASHESLAWTYLQKQEQREAIFHYEAALRMNPASYAAMLNLARLRAVADDESLRDGQAALDLLERARKGLGGRSSVRLLDIEGMAKAQLGRYEEAAECAEAAIALAESQGMTGLGKIRERLALYRAGEPYVEKKQPR